MRVQNYVFVMKNQTPVYFFIFIVIHILSQSAYCQSKSPIAQKADSLFNSKKYEEAANLYEQILSKHQINEENTYLKLAYISENSGNFSKAIYYLSEYYFRKPGDEVFNKISKMADENSFKGYSKSDFNFFVLIIKEYYNWFILGICLIFCYIFGIMVSKKMKDQSISLNHKVLLLIFMILVLAINAFPNVIRNGIVMKPSVYLRNEPTNGGAITQLVNEGTQLYIFGKKDIWWKVFLDRKIHYIKSSDIAIIGEDKLDLK